MYSYVMPGLSHFDENGTSAFTSQSSNKSRYKHQSQVETKMMVKIGAIFMSFSNPTCHFRDTADFTVCSVCTLGKVRCSSEMASRI